LAIFNSMKLQDNIAKEFNEFSKNYLDDMVKVVPYYLQLLEHFTMDIPHHFIPKDILDLGCGNGIITSKLLSIFPDAHYTFLDASDKMLELCEMQFGLQNKTYVSSYFQDYQFQDQCFDLVAAGFSLHHCPAKDKQTLFKSIFKSLKPHGVFMCSDLMIDKNEPSHQVLLEYWKSFVIKTPTDQDIWDWLMEHYQAYDHPDALNNQLDWLKQAGFTNFKIDVFHNYWVHLKASKA